MAKGNPFLGMARGKVGDVVFYRQQGKQITRARNSAPSNPRTDGQLVQRAVTATVMQAYKAGRVIFDHSFEGRRVGAENQQRFLSVNMAKLREQVLADIAAGRPAGLATARVVQPKAVWPTPNTYRVSEGNLVQNFFGIEVFTGGLSQTYIIDYSESAQVGTFLTSHGVVADDIFTIVAFGYRIPSGGVAYTPDDLVAPQTQFGFIRLRVKASALTLTKTMAQATLGDVFVINETGGTPIPDSTVLGGGINIDQVVASAIGGAMGVIRSRENSGERSTCDLMSPASNEVGVAAVNLLAAWSPVNAGLDSTLILEGGGFGKIEDTPTPVIPAEYPANPVGNTLVAIPWENNGTIVVRVGAINPSGTTVDIPITTDSKWYNINVRTGSISAGSTNVDAALTEAVRRLGVERSNYSWVAGSAYPAEVISVPYLISDEP